MIETMASSELPEASTSVTWCSGEEEDAIIDVFLFLLN